MSQEERMKVCKEAQICLVCISPNVNFTSAHLTDCPVMKAIQRDGRGNSIAR